MPCTTPYARTPCDLMTAVRHIGSEMRNIFKNDQNLFKFFGWLLLGLAQFILCSTLRIWKFRKAIQWRHSKFEPDKAQYSTPNFFDRLFLIRAYWNPKSRQGPEKYYHSLIFIIHWLDAWKDKNNWLLKPWFLETSEA